MKSLLTILSVAALLTSCAYENDPGLQPKNDQAKNQVKDSLKDKTVAEVLTLKYSAAVAKCKLEMKEAAAAVVAEATAEAPPANEPVQNPKEDELLFDLKAQVVADPDLKKPVAAKLMNTRDGQVTTVELTLKPEAADLTLPMGKVFYFMKHSPQVSYEYMFSVTNGKNSVKVPGTGKINEKVETSKVVGQSELTVDEVTKKYDHVLTCSVETTVLKDSPNVAEFESQFESVDCAQPVKKGQEELYKANCK